MCLKIKIKIKIRRIRKIKIRRKATVYCSDKKESYNWVDNIRASCIFCGLVSLFFNSRDRILCHDFAYSRQK